MNIQAIEEQTDLLVAAGHKVLQIHRFAAGEAAHVARLAHWADFGTNWSVIDMGSGTGGVARLWSEFRPDLDFTLVNISKGQLRHSPEWMSQVCCDMCDVPVGNGEFDAAIFCFSIGHADTLEALQEASRLVRHGGVVFIYDMARISGDNASMEIVDYQVHHRAVMEGAALQCGLLLDVYLEPQDDGAYGRAVIGDDYHHVFNGTIPAIWRFLKN